ncbi:putative jacalin-like lectin domain-containing protein [Arabidopsis thaliana]
MEYPSEYLISLEGSYDKVDGSEVKVLLMLKFKTNKRTSKAFGLDMISNFVLHKEGHKMVGFHGKPTTCFIKLVSMSYPLPTNHFSYLLKQYLPKLCSTL